MIIRNLNEIDEILENKKIAIFDLDGTIIDSEVMHFNAHNEVLKEG
ncbi:MAG: HAD hydrolase-like protein [Clostridia bacterium]|nr:HAD hydrolase-like protein [Clostridia bacterium]